MHPTFDGRRVARQMALPSAIEWRLESIARLATRALGKGDALGPALVHPLAWTTQWANAHPWPKAMFWRLQSKDWLPLKTNRQALDLMAPHSASVHWLAHRTSLATALRLATRPQGLSTHGRVPSDG